MKIGSCLDGYSFTTEEQLECNIVNRVDVLKSASHFYILGTLYGEKHIQFWIWPDTENGTFTAEFVFLAIMFSIYLQAMTNIWKRSKQFIHSLKWYERIIKNVNVYCQAPKWATQGKNEKRTGQFFGSLRLI